MTMARASCRRYRNPVVSLRHPLRWCALLLAEGTCNRKDWIEKRLEELAEIFAISVGGFSILDNHLHVLV